MVVASWGATGRLWNRLPTGAVWLKNEVPACRVLPAGWLERGACAVIVLDSDVPIAVFVPA